MPEPRPEEFRRFHELLTEHAPDGYTPWYFRCRKASKAPDTSYGSWKDESARLSAEEAIEWMEQGGNVGIAGTDGDDLVNVDIDDEDETDPDDLKPTLIARSRSRVGCHGWYFEAPGADIPNIPTDDAGEVRANWQYVVAPGSYVPVDFDDPDESDKEDIPDEYLDDVGYYTVDREDPVTSIRMAELPDVFIRQHTESEQDDTDAEVNFQMPESSSDADGGSEYRSALFDISAEDVVRKERGSTDTDDRWSAIFHGSKTDANMSVSSKGLIQCWRHNVTHNGIQALVTLSNYSGGCASVGTGHTGSGAGDSCIKKEDGAHIWHAWKYAKINGYLPDDDPVPYNALRHLCRDRDLCAVTEIPDSYDDGSLPAHAYDAALRTIEEHDGLDPGRSPTEEISSESSSSGPDPDTDTGTDADDDDGVWSPIERFDGGLRIWKETKDGDWYSEKLTNFWVDVDAILERDDGSAEYLLTVDPVAESEYQIAVEPVVFNDKRQFESKVCGEGLSATYDGSTSDLNRLKEYVAQQDAPVRRGTEHIGLHGDEWVVPDGTLTADGWTDNPESVFEAANTPLANKCSVTPEMGADYDQESVREILRLLPKTRLTERFLPAMGWFYAAATRPYIQQWEGEFNILAVTGDSGAGKTATLETLWSCFGVGGDLLRADGTTFPKMRALATSNALPIVFDEYKPADMSSYAVDQFHSLLRTSTRGGIEEKGRPDGSVVGHELLAPAVISGEQALRGTAEERRTLQTNFSRQASVGGTPESEAFARLTGGDVDGEVTDGYDLSGHAIAYYQWILTQDEADLRKIWRRAREDASTSVSELGIDGLDDMRLQAIQTLIYGCRLYQAFAADVGLDKHDIPIGDREVDRAVKYILNERTSTDHVSNLDRFLELACRAAASSYLQRGEHYEITHEAEPDEELRIKLSLVYDQLRRYARDHDIQDADLLDSDTDYRSRIADAAEDEDSYVISKSKQTRGLNRCVAIATGKAEATIEGFEISMLRAADEEDVEEDNEDDMTPGFSLNDLDASRGQPVTFRATATSILDPKPWLQAEGILQDDSGVARFIARGTENPVADVDEGERIEVRDAMVTTNDNGAPVVELIDGLTTIESAASARQQTGLEQAASTDGGEPVNKPIDDHVRTADGGDVITVASVAGEVGADPDVVKARLDTLVSEKGLLTETDDGYEVL